MARLSFPYLVSDCGKERLSRYLVIAELDGLEPGQLWVGRPGVGQLALESARERQL